jgi:hypothetical protein
MTTEFLLVALLAHGTGASDWPTISLDLQAPVPAARQAAHGEGTRLDNLMTAASKGSGPVVIELALTVRASRAGDVRFDRSALRLEIQDLAGSALSSTCIPKYGKGDLFLRPDYVRLAAGEAMTIKLKVSETCRHLIPRERYAIVGVFGPAGDDFADFDLTPPPRDGATLVTRRVESKRIVIRWPPAARP